MSESLPDSWAQAPLSAISGDAIQRVPSPDDEFSYIDIGSIDRQTKRIATPQPMIGHDAPSRARKVVCTGDTLVSMTRPNLNAVALVPPEFDGQIASTGFDVLRPAGVDSRWLYYLVRTQAFVDAMSSIVQGALYPAVRSKDVRGFLAPVAPLEEQKRIADQLDSVLARLAECKSRIDSISAILGQLRRCVVNAAASGQLTEELDSKNEQSPPTNSYPLVPLLQVITEPLRNGKSVRDGDGLKVLRLTALKSDGIDLEEAKAGDWAGVSNVNRFLVHDGDFLISRGNGSKDLVGRGGLVDGCREQIAFPDTMIRLRPDPSQLLPGYLRLVWNSDVIRSQIESAARTTAGIWKVSQGDLESVRIPLPSTGEQAEITRRVESLFAFVDRLEARYKAARAHVARLTPLLLAKAFRGELVPQDPNDEPASALLARIAAERAATAATPRPRKATPGRKPARAPKENAAMTKSRQDDDVQGQPYLAKHLRLLGGSAPAEALFKASELPVADFYKQLAWEVAQGHLLDGKTVLELPDAA